jgi:LacI family transcriptional regulator
MATIKDVARLAGVGVGTVSRVLTGNGAASAEAIARVMTAVEALDFRPSGIARALSLRMLGMFGIYVPAFNGTFYGPLLQAVDEELRSADRHMVAANGCGHGDARQQALDAIDFLIQRECDGILVESQDLDPQDLTALARSFPKIAVINRSVPGLASQCFGSDHELGGRLAARALLQRGHREVALISGARSAYDNQARLHGFVDEFHRHGIAIPPERLADGDFTFESGYQAASRLVQRGGNRFTALFAANDQMAIAATTLLHQRGRRVPDDVSVVGYDDTEPAGYSWPRLTTVRIPIKAQAVNACRYLLNRCYGTDLAVERDFPPEVIWRDSVADGPYPPLPAARTRRSAR